ncbi:response regulator [Vibrio owensii]|uniref:response regulator n=1 Tax=Vibrio owensii TaxID=696485 RepID=UPI00059773D3|nr:response regulator [Vibrio owensii]
MLNPFKELSVLIVDDAPPILTTIKIMLIRFGFAEQNIVTAKTAKLALVQASAREFDIVIADFNLGNGLNGKQLYEELIHYNHLNCNAIFILITGDSSASTVRPIIELRPDEYILKPFTANNLKQRLVMALHRKRVLAPLYKAERDLNPQAGLRLCEEIAPFNKEYFFEIEQFRTSFLSMLSMHSEAEKAFTSILDKKQANWAKLGLANTLAHLGNHQQANEIVANLLSTLPNDTYVRTEAAKINLLNNKIPHAISHLELASKTTPGNSERELVIANLCLSVEDYQQAIARYKIYIELNKNTYRSDLYSEVNLIRLMLYQCLSNKTDTRCLDEAKQRIRILLEKKYTNLEVEVDLIVAHYAVLQGNYSVATNLLKKIKATGNSLHFYAQYHFLWLANFLELEDDFCASFKQAKNSLAIEQSQIVFASKLALLDEIYKRNQLKNEWLDEQVNLLQDDKLPASAQLEICMRIHERNPLLKQICIKIVELLRSAWPVGKGGRQVENIVEGCDHVIRQLFEPAFLFESKYEDSLFIALEKCKARV